MEKEKEVKKDDLKSMMIKIKPKKDFKFQFGKDKYVLLKDVEVELPKMFEKNLKTEKVI